jgi:hypothetical protein
VIHIVAGPGYGKTAFVVDLLSSAPGRTVYYSLDESDRDPVSFLTYLMAGLGIEPGSRPTSPVWDWANPSGESGAVLDLAAELVGFVDRSGQPTPWPSMTRISSTVNPRCLR